MIVTRNGRPMVLLAAVNESNLEKSLWALRRARAIDGVSNLQQQSAKQGTDRLSIEKIDTEIKAVRRKRAR